MRPHPPPRRFASSALIAVAGATLLLAGCMNLSNDDPAIPELQPLKSVPVYAHSADFSEISGVLFKPFRDEPYWGIAFSHEPDAPYGGYFVLGSTEALVGRTVGDKVTLTGRPTDDRFSPWQSGTFYEILSVRLTDPYAADPAWPSGVHPGFDELYTRGRLE